jgi:hypothetical protein
MLKFDRWWVALVYLMYVGCLVIYPYYPTIILPTLYCSTGMKLHSRTIL